MNDNDFYNSAPLFFKNTFSKEHLHEVLDLMYWDNAANEFIPGAVITRAEAYENFKINFSARFPVCFIPASYIPHDLTARAEIAESARDMLFSVALHALDQIGEIRLYRSGDIEQIHAGRTDAQRRMINPLQSELALTLAVARRMAQLPCGYLGAAEYEEACTDEATRIFSDGLDDAQICARYLERQGKRKAAAQEADKKHHVCAMPARVSHSFYSAEYQARRDAFRQYGNAY